MTEQNMFRWEVDPAGVLVLTMDDLDQSANTMNDRFRRDLVATVDRLEAERDQLGGVVLTSAKKTFFAGGDLNQLIRATPQDAARIAEHVDAIKAALRRLETCGLPVVAAINGAALGGGYELALACHRRIALDAEGSRIGLPEVTLGLLPGAGGIVRTVARFGIQDALTNILLEGQRRTPRQALALGMVDEVVDTADELLGRAKEWIRATPEAVQPWDKPGYRIPGGTPATPALAATLPTFPATVRKRLKGAPMPAPRNILAAAVEGAQVDFDTAMKIETRYLIELAVSQVAKNMIKAFHVDLRHINSGGSRPAGHPKHVPQRVAVLGAGMMGAAIAAVCAASGLTVVLKDVSADAAARGKAYSRALVDKRIVGGSMTTEQAEELLARITPTDQVDDVAGADLVIEAVYESPELKKRVFAEIEDLVAPDAVLGSNTSTLPISELAEGVKHPENFIGLHFFSPADKMPLLEIVVGARTSEATLAKALDIAQRIKKTPIVVRDARGFFTSRVISTYLNEAVAMVGEGVPAASIEQAGAQAGYPTSPLRLLDDLTLTLPRKIRQESQAAAVAAGRTWVAHPADEIIDRMIDEFGRAGRSSGAGFYDYADGLRTGLWPGLAEHFGADHTRVPFDDLRERMLFAEALEAVRCFDEGVLTSVPDANIGSLFGIGFPPWTGGVIQFLNQYEGGLPGAVARAEELAGRYGERFTPPESLVAKARQAQQYE